MYEIIVCLLSLRVAPRLAVEGRRSNPVTASINTEIASLLSVARNDEAQATLGNLIYNVCNGKVAEIQTSLRGDGGDKCFSCRGPAGARFLAGTFRRPDCRPAPGIKLHPYYRRSAPTGGFCVYSGSVHFVFFLFYTSGRPSVGTCRTGCVLQVWKQSGICRPADMDYGDKFLAGENS